MAQLAEKGAGEVIDDPAEIFTSLADTVKIEKDPRIVLIIAAIVLVLLDIAARKFKFKWLHEIIGERRNKKQ